MMREILFRGKRVFNGQWLLGGFHSRFGRAFIVGCSKSFRFEGMDVIPETVGQFTGLYDKNGKQIFEGDIMQYQINFKTVLTGKIVFALGAFQFETAEHERERFSFDDLEIVMSPEYCEVIGNIHDNPEILKIKQKKDDESC